MANPEGGSGPRVPTLLCEARVSREFWREDRAFAHSPKWLSESVTPIVERAVGVAVLAGVYIAAARFGFAFANVVPNVSPVWPPSGLALAALLLGGRGLWPGVALGAFLANATSAMPVPLLGATGIALGNTLAAWLGAFLLDRGCGFRNAMDRIRDVTALIAVACILPTLAGALLGTISMQASGYLPPDHFGLVWRTWWAGDALGTLVVAPLALAWIGWRPRAWAAWRYVEAALLGIGLILACQIVFARNFGATWSAFPLAFLTFPFLIWSSVRFGLRGATGAGGIVAAAAIQSLVWESGPFRAPSIAENVWMLQSFVAVSMISSLLVSSLQAESRSASDALRASERKLEESQKFESLGILAGGIAHDFNNLLTVILGNAALARGRPGTPPELGRFLSEIELASDRAAELCRQMLSFAGRTPGKVENVDLSELVRETISLSAGRIPKTIRLRLELVDRLPPVRGDRVQLQQIALNLLVNAADAMPVGSGELTVRTAIRRLGRADLAESRLELGARPGDFVELTVCDNGVGMDAMTRDRIFDPFFTTKVTGHGLGLAVLLGIVRLHGGAISVRSAPEEGTEMRVFLPVSKVAETRQNTTTEAATEWRGHGRVLVADDEPGVLCVVQQTLERMGFEVTAVTSGEEAVEVIRRLGSSIRAVVMDYAMPGMGGSDAARTVRALCPGMPLAVISGYVEPEVSLDLAGDGPTMFIAKPFTPRAFSARMRDLLSPQ